jgi:hypothetical protein
MTDDKQIRLPILPRIEITPIDPKYGMAVIDGKLRVVKNSTAQPIPEDEPLCLFRARDNIALVGALIPYRTECGEEGCTDFQMRGIQNRIDAFYVFRKDHPERMKQPGITRGL